MQIKPLTGLKVVDLTHVLAGPYCTYQLGLLGAEVIKVESLKGDMVRGWLGSKDQLKRKLGFGFVPQNAGKRSLSVDITQPQGADLVVALAREADIFVENYRPGALAKYGLGYDDLRKINPALIYASISAFGQNGPHGHRPGYDDVIQATSGYMAISERDDGPVHTGGPVLDYATGIQATSAVLAAVLMKEKTGEGQRLDIALQDVSMMLSNRLTSESATTGIPPKPYGNRSAALMGRFKAKEGYVSLAGYLPHQCRALCAALGLLQYAEFSGREFANRNEEVERAVEVRLLERTASDWDEIFSEAGVVAGAVRNNVEAFATGQPEAREMLVSVDSAAGEFQVTTNGYRINDTVFKPASGVPMLGEHTSEILDELGLDQARIDELAKSGIIRMEMID